MKKFYSIVTIIICLAIMFSLVACDKGENQNKEDDSSNNNTAYSVTTKPTNTTSGIITESASGNTVVLPVLNSDDYYYNVISAATCVAQGSAEYTWKNTEYGSFSFPVTIPVNSEVHTYELTDYIAATEENDGSRTYVCKNCGATYSETVVYKKYNSEESTVITYANNSAVVDNDNGGVMVNGTTVTITTAGVYDFSGSCENGRIVVSAGDGDKVEIALNGILLSSSDSAVIEVQSADSVDISAKKGTVNVLEDKREASSTEGAEGGVVYSSCDLDVKGNGSLTVISSYNNGIATSGDLKIKNLTLRVEAVNNALKGNDSVTINSGCLTIISSGGDGIKTTNSDVSDKGNQRGTVTINGGSVNIYAACDGIDAEYDVLINEVESDNPLSLNIYTDKYSEYSGEVTATSDSTMYIRTSTPRYAYSVCFADENGNEIWENASYYTSIQSGGRPGSFRSTYYYYQLNKPSGYTNMTIYVYSSGQTQGTTEAEYSADMTVNTNYDTLALSIGTTLSASWTNYTTMQPGMGPGGMQEGNSDKGDYSTKGIKAQNNITISGGNINITSYDDAIHANAGVTLENGSVGDGTITVTGGALVLSSCDDAIHGDGSVTVNGGNVKIGKSYEGIEGSTITVSGGTISVIASDDGINAYSSISLQGGYLYVLAGGDGLDSNGYMSISGGTITVISTSNGNSCMDTDRGYSFTGGTVLAIAPSGSMWQEVIGYVKSGTYKTFIGSVSAGSILNVKDTSGNVVASVKLPVSISIGAVFMSDNVSSPSSVTFSISASGSVTYDENGVYIK